MAQHHDLRVLGPLRTAQQQQPTEQPNHEHIDHPHRHDPNPGRRRSALPTWPGADTEGVFTVHGTKKFLDRVSDNPIPASDLQPATTILGGWYATVLFWKQHVTLFVNEPTRLPLFVPLAPARTVTTRLTETAASMFAALGLPEAFIATEVSAMAHHQMTKTASRSVLGTMNDFAYLADAHRTPKQVPDLLDLSLNLAKTPCGPLYGSHISPDRELFAYVTDHNR